MAEVMSHRSSHVSQTSYDHDSGDLTVMFTDGSTWLYRGVPRGTYTRLITAPSKGRAFNALIRDSFESEEV
jgi:hypothetical protein